ncbi:MAG: enoyl-CoA hydratase [Burkholderiales bacterium]
MNQPTVNAAIAAAEPLVIRHDQDGVATLTLNRPKQYNALSSAVLTTLQESLDAIAKDGTVRVVVIAGAGSAFCAGHDLKEMRANYELGATQALFEQCSKMMKTLTALPQPVIAKVHGIATAAGCQLVAQCDLAIASDNASFATSGINVGLFCATPGVPLSRNLFRKQAMEMLLTGDFIDAKTAMQRGLVNRVAPLDKIDESLAEMIQAIIAKPASVLALGKKLFYQQLEMDMSDAYTHASGVMACNFLMPEAAEGVDAFMQKRPAKWPE